MNTNQLFPATHLTAPFKLMHPIFIETVYTFFFNEVSPEFYFNGEVHEAWEMVYVISGEVGISADERICTLKAKQFLLHKPMEFHKIWGVKEHTKLFIISFDLSGSRVTELKQYSGIPFSIEHHTISGLIAQLETLPVSSSGHITDFISHWNGTESALYHTIHTLESVFLHLIDTPNITFASDSLPDSRLYAKMIKVMEDHIHTELSICELARLCSVSSATAKNCFSHYAGCGIHKYFLKLKIRTAITLIRQGVPISEVSDRLGFNNPNYFSFVFKRETGRRPSDYKHAT